MPTRVTPSHHTEGAVGKAELVQSVSLSRTVAAAPRTPSLRVMETAAMFGLGADDQRRFTIVPHCEIPLPQPGVIYITGPSGGGKSTILALLAEQAKTIDRPVLNVDHLPATLDTPLVDAVGNSVQEAMSLLSLVGLGEAFVMLRTPGELSDGQRYRFNLARLIEAAETHHPNALILADEFAATLDRLTAKIVSHNIRRWISKTNHTFVCATTHDDLIDSLQPDVLIWKGFDDELDITKPPAANGNSRTSPSFQAARSVTEHLRIETGSTSDYQRLAGFHYKSTHPGAVTGVLRLVQGAPTIVGRYLNRRNESQLVGVLVRSLPSLSCRLRDLATSGRYRGLTRRGSAALLNRELRTISRVVIHPQWRGLSLAVTLVRHALDHPDAEIVYTEALAAMGRVSPFFERAGMVRYDRPPHPHDARLLDALQHLGLDPAMLASSRTLETRLRTCDDAARQWLESELRRWVRAARHMPRSNLNELSMSDLLIAARDDLLVQPVYYLYRHVNGRGT